MKLKVYVTVKYLLVKKITIIPKSRVKMTKLKGDVAHEYNNDPKDLKYHLNPSNGYPNFVNSFRLLMTRFLLSMH